MACPCQVDGPAAEVLMMADSKAVGYLKKAHAQLVKEYDSINPASPAAAVLRACIAKVNATAAYVASNAPAADTADQESED